jgi:hypothetical protein
VVVVGAAAGLAVGGLLWPDRDGRDVVTTDSSTTTTSTSTSSTSSTELPASTTTTLAAEPQPTATVPSGASEPVVEVVVCEGAQAMPSSGRELLGLAIPCHPPLEFLQAPTRSLSVSTLSPSNVDIVVDLVPTGDGSYDFPYLDADASTGVEEGLVAVVRYVFEKTMSPPLNRPTGPVDVIRLEFTITVTFT